MSIHLKISGFENVLGELSGENKLLGVRTSSKEVTKKSPTETDFEEQSEKGQKDYMSVTGGRNVFFE